MSSSIYETAVLHEKITFKIQFHNITADVLSASQQNCCHPLPSSSATHANDFQDNAGSYDLTPTYQLCSVMPIRSMQCSKGALRTMHSTERNNGYLLFCAVVTIYITVIMFILTLLHVLCHVSRHFCIFILTKEALPWFTKRIFLISSHK